MHFRLDVPMTRLLLLAAIGLSPLATSAQSLPGWAAPSEPVAPVQAADPPGPPGGSNVPQQVPIDGGLGLLALAGGAYAAKRLRQSKA